MGCPGEPWHLINMITKPNKVNVQKYHYLSNKLVLLSDMIKIYPNNKKLIKKFKKTSKCLIKMDMSIPRYCK